MCPESLKQRSSVIKKFEFNITMLKGDIGMDRHQNTGEYRKKIENYSFCLGDKIGRGYSSTVYKGRNDLTNETVAIKVIELKSLRDQVSRGLLQAQLECIRSIKHENLLKYIDSYQTVNNCYIITQYCDGGDVEKQLKKKGKFSESELKQFFFQFYLGYKHFIQAGYIHRDIKPANIFMKQGRVKIADFGFVKKLSQNPKQSYNVGTPVYMSPEALTANIYTQKSDIWSIGVMCYQLTHGKMPWRGANEKQLKNNIQGAAINMDRELISYELQDFITSCLHKNPLNRITVKEMEKHPWLQKPKASFPPTPSQQIFTPSYLLPSLRQKHTRPPTSPEISSPIEPISKHSTLDHLVSILNLLRFTFKIYKFINENKIQNKDNIKNVLLYQLMNDLEKQQTMITTGENIYQLKGWETFKKSSKWKVYRSVVEQYSEKYRKLEFYKENFSTFKLLPFLNSLYKYVKKLKTMDFGGKNLYRNIEALDYLISLENLRQLTEKENWESLLTKSPINTIVECRCQVDAENSSEVLMKLQKKLTLLY